MVRLILCLVFLLTSFVEAASVTSLGITFNTTGGNTTVTATPAVNDLIIIVAAATGSNATNAATTAITDNQSGTYTMVVEGDATSSPRVNIWIRNSLVTTSTSTVYTATQVNSNGGGLQVFSVSGMTKVGPSAVRQVNKSTGNSITTPAVTMGVAFLTGNAGIGAVVNGTSPAGLTQPSSWTESQDVGYSTPSTGLETVFRNSGETGTTITWGSSSTSQHKDIVLELDTSLNAMLMMFPR